MQDDEEEEARKERLKSKMPTLSKEEEAKLARQKEVEAELADQLKERDKEMEKHKFLEAEEHFKALLADLVSTVLRFLGCYSYDDSDKLIREPKARFLMSYFVARLRLLEMYSKTFLKARFCCF